MRALYHYGLYIDGRLHDVVRERSIEVENPATGEIIGSVTDASPEEVAGAVEAASRAFHDGRWSGMDPLERGRVLTKIGELLADNLERFVSLDAASAGRPVREMRAQISRLPEWFYYFAGLPKAFEGQVIPFKGNYLNYRHARPLGVVALLTPWNHPLLIFVKKLAAALAAGNCVVAKPSELAPFSVLEFARMTEEAGLPPGVLNIVTGYGATAGAALVDAPQVRKIDLTGGTRTGQIIAAAAAQRLVPVTLELGGNTPMVVFDDTPLDEAVAMAAFAAFIGTGQTCVAGARVLVQRTMYGRFCEAFKQKTEGIRLGNPLDPATQLGPLASRNQLEQALRYVQIGRDEGASLLCGGREPDLPPPLDGGHFMLPTVFADVTPDMRLFKEEIFGPVVAVTPFDTEEEAVELANGTPYGLGGSVWTKDVRRAHRVAQRLECGIVWVNDHHKNDPASPWGGGRLSGYGHENGWAALLEYSQHRSVVVKMDDGYSDWYGAGESAGRYG